MKVDDQDDGDEYKSDEDDVPMFKTDDKTLISDTEA